MARYRVMISDAETLCPLARNEVFTHPDSLSLSLFSQLLLVLELFVEHRQFLGC